MPLSSQVGDIVAGIASSQEEVNGLYYLKNARVLEEVKEKFQVKGAKEDLKIHWNFQGAGKPRQEA